MTRGLRKNLMERFVQKIEKTEQNVLMAVIFHVGNRIVIETACLKLADILFMLYLYMGTQREYNS